MRSFRTVARLGGISAAANRLGIAKSGVSRHIALLEAHFGVRLLERSARAVKLTPIGLRLNDRIASILAEIDLLDDIAREESAGIAGQVSIAATPEFGGLVAATLFPVIRSEHPEIKLTLRTGYAFEDMQDPSTDIAFRVGSFKDDRLVARQLGVFRAWLVAAPDFLARHPVHAAEDLSDVPCLIFRGDRNATTWTMHGAEGETTVDVTAPIAVRSFTVLMDLAIAGHGVAFLPNFMLGPALKRGALVRCLPDRTSRPFSVYLAFRPGARRIAPLDAVLSLAEQHVPALLHS